MQEVRRQLRERVQHNLDLLLFPSALFFADKLKDISNGAIEDVYLYARCLFLSAEYHRAFDVLVRSQCHSKDIKCLYLAARCKAELQLWEECIDLLGDEDEDEEDGDLEMIIEEEEIEREGEGRVRMREKRGREGEERESGREKEREGKDHGTEAAICLLRGKAFEFKENRERATYWFVRALKHDACSVEALTALTRHHLMTSSDERNLVRSLSFSPSDSWLRPLYSCFLKKYDQNPTASLSVLKGDAVLSRLENNTDVVTANAEHEFYKNNFRRAYSLTKKILENDPYNNGTALVVHISILVELKLKAELFELCHKLVEGSGHTAIAWYGVGCYYYLLKNFENARRYFNKATSIESHFGPAWMGFGHSFAAQGEHDQAMAAYRTAARILEGSHHPPLSIGTELIRVYNLPLASQYLDQAKQLCPSDPLIYNELGVIYYLNKDYPIAIEYFKKVLEICEAADSNAEREKEKEKEKAKEATIDGGLVRLSTLSAAWDPTVVNLAHCYRKLGDYTQAVQYYEISLSLNPFDDSTASTYAALGFTQHLMGNIELAIQYYHQSLGLKDDSFASTMLNKALEDLLEV